MRASFADSTGGPTRRSARRVMVGGIGIGGGLPIVIQSMTNTDTADVVATTAQVAELAGAGSEMVRLTVNTREAANAVPVIRERLLALNVDVPLIGDFHFNGHKLLTEVPACAEALDKLRINPGNVGKGSRRDEQFAQIIAIAVKYRKPVRIGVNWGSLDQQLLARVMDENARRAEPKDANGIMREAMVASALESAAKAEELGLAGDTVVLSCKVSGVQDLIAIYRELARRCDYPLHLGLTEAGMGMENRRQAKFLPESLENQGRADFDGMGCDIDLTGKNQQCLLRKPGKRADKGFDASFGLKLIKATNGCDDALAYFAADLAVFDELQVLVPAGFFDSCKHSGLLC